MVQDFGANVLLRARPSYATVSWATADGFKDVASISTPCLAWGPTINKYLKHRGNGGIVWNGAIIERWCVAFSWWKMPLGVQGSLYTLNANKNFTKPPAVLNTKAQLANWQVTSTQASWADLHTCACVCPSRLENLEILTWWHSRDLSAISSKSANSSIQLWYNLSFHVFPPQKKRHTLSSKIRWCQSRQSDW